MQKGEGGLFGGILVGSLDNYPQTLQALRELMQAEAAWRERLLMPIPIPEAWLDELRKKYEA